MGSLQRLMFDVHVLVSHGISLEERVRRSRQAEKQLMSDFAK